LGPFHPLPLPLRLRLRRISQPSGPGPSTARYRKVLPTITNNNFFTFGIPVKMHSDRFSDVFIGPYLEVAEHLNLSAFVLECPLATHGIVCHHALRFLCRILVLTKNFPRLVISPFEQFDSVF